MGCRDPICDAVVDLHQNRPLTAFEALDHPTFPKRVIAIQPPLHQSCGQSVQGGVVTWLRNRRAPHVVGKVEGEVIHPRRGTEIEWMRMQYLLEPRNFCQPLTQTRGELRGFGHGPCKYR